MAHVVGIDPTSEAFQASANPSQLYVVWKLAPKGGIEPPTYRLTAGRNYRCATWELKLADMLGIEPNSTG